MRKDYSVPRNFSWIENYKLFKVARRVQVAYLKEQNQQFFTVFQNKFLKHVFNIILKLNNLTWKNNKIIFCGKKIDPNSGFIVAKKAPSFWKKFFLKKTFFQRICADMIFKTVSGNFFKINGSGDTYVSVISRFPETVLHNKIANKT